MSTECGVEAIRLEVEKQSIPHWSHRHLVSPSPSKRSQACSSVALRVAETEAECGWGGIPGATWF